ncbi:hypothetical protein CRT60_00340 [Azospirillum palustre]|uniref:Tail fiber domain-containing protein n=1 Tax=Azospirillum palustre TaxID=2044885 RepID=A0A2B8BKZ9_9PROT|nr:hypothetical protein [Azospirillum palustre]PGH59466.1 hypothetical protein CRT60_00340 [Azospirillum palustre]
MSGGGGSTQTVQQSVPAYLQNQHQQNLSDANAVTGMEYQPYTGPRIAGWTGDQTNAFNMLRGSIGSWQPTMNTATAAASGIASGQQAVPQVQAPSQTFNAQSYLSANPDVAAWAKGEAAATGKSLDELANQHWNTFGMAENRQGATMAAQAPQIDRGAIRNVTAGKFTDADLSAYENPYTQSVIDTTLNTLSRQNDILRNQSNARAAAAGAFGGSRQAVMNSEGDRNYLDQVASTTAQLNNQKFAQAQAAISADQTRALQADAANQGMDWNTANTNAGYDWNASALNANQGMQAALANQSAGLQGTGQQLTAAQLLAALGGQGRAMREIG